MHDGLQGLLRSMLGHFWTFQSHDMITGLMLYAAINLYFCAAEWAVIAYLRLLEDVA